MAAAAGLAGGAGVAAEPASPATATPTLDMFDQLALEQRALRILAMPQVQAQKKAAEALFRNHPLAKIPDGGARAELAAERYAIAAVENAILDDPVRPKIMWVITQPRRWHGVDWPGSAWGGHNPDNFSRDVVIDGQSRYEIHGQRTGAGPAQQTMLIYGSNIGTQAQSVEGAEVLSSLQDTELKVAADGSFTVTIGPEPATPGANHLQSGPNAKLLKIRNALEDWWTQVPNRLRIVRVSGPYAPPKTDEQVADEAARLLKLQVPYWLRFNDERLFNAPANTVVSLGGRQGGWGYLTSGWFQLKDDEAFVVTIDTIGADYVGFQVTDVWSIPPDYIHHLAGLNKSQAKPNPDGTYTFVVGPKDPGVFNWVDTVGLHAGTFLIRWQRLANKSVTSDGAVRSAKVVKLADLRSVLPPGTAWVDAAARKRQIEDRVASFDRRLEN